MVDASQLIPIERFAEISIAKVSLFSTKKQETTDM
jgi:hypothetical protein